MLCTWSLFRVCYGTKLIFSAEVSILRQLSEETNTDLSRRTPESEKE